MLLDGEPLDGYVTEQDHYLYWAIVATIARIPGTGVPSATTGEEECTQLLSPGQGTACAALGTDPVSGGTVDNFAACRKFDIIVVPF
ncbi:MAG: hypothetical protein IPK99_02295 [Flavobacteriales bacterium]|nr:hypothetical protein [Flavobacteriales bacterium]